jgi:hypothetical protein
MLQGIEPIAEMVSRPDTEQRRNLLGFEDLADRQQSPYSPRPEERRGPWVVALDRLEWVGPQCGCICWREGEG